jgi:hypothetical protein
MSKERWRVFNDDMIAIANESTEVIMSLRAVQAKRPAWTVSIAVHDEDSFEN